MNKPPAAGRVALLAILLVALGFVLGLGYQTIQHAQQTPDKTPAPTTRRAPLVRGLRVSPDDKLLAFTSIYDNAQQAGRFLFDLKTYRWNEAQSPAGWQDSITQWSTDSKRVLFARERIPRAANGGEAGLYQEQITPPTNEGKRNEPEALSAGAEPPGEKAYAGFWTPDGKLVMKTRRDSKALFLKQEGEAQLIDDSPGTYYQNRAVTENGATAYYVVRDITQQNGKSALFRIQNGNSRQIGSSFNEIAWAYLAENARWMLVCTFAENGRDWQWSLYSVSPTQLKLEKQAQIPEDVIAVYWSPDFKKVLGAAGKSLWLIDVPSLQTRKLGDFNEWNADDAAWLNKENKVIVASAGKLWKVDVATGKRMEMWKFPNKYWD